MAEISILVPKDFFKEEVRCDYTISEKMKKVWAVELDLLYELDRVCRKHHLRYFADSGTLIGAVRHKGFIPWGDDIDIVMFRKDYNILRDIAAKEFKYPIFLQNAYSDNRNTRGFSKLRNSSTTTITMADTVKNYNFGIFIDIFPLDNVPDNKIAFEIWRRRVKLIKKLSDPGVYFTADHYKSPLKKACWFVSKTLVDLVGYKNVFKHFESVCSMYNRKRTKCVTYVAHSYGKKKHIWNRSCFAHLHRVPFEFMEINIPDGYDSRLRTEYGDYMKPAKAPTTHQDIVIEPDIPYKEYLKLNSMKDIKNRFILNYS